ncbi:hypothetical protein [Candidatus Magnetobacterium casense]|nr:hypothetical protein [Candidatus Magnetobacterium casensis]
MTYCRVIKVDYTNDTCDVVELDDDLNDTCIVHLNVPIYYHCWPDMTLRANGALEGSSSAFEVNDKVVIQSRYDLSSNFVPWAVLSFYDKKKPCGDKLFFVFVDDRLMTGPFDSDSTHLKQIVKNVALKIDGTIMKLSEQSVIVTIDMNGGLLVVQSSEDKNENLATIPTKFTMATSLSYEPGYGESQWNSVHEMFNHNVLNGSYRAWNPLEGMGYCLTARRGYKLDADGIVTTCYYTVKTELMTPLNCYCYVGLLPTNRTKVKQTIQYKDTPFDTTFKDGILIGEDFESPPAMILKDGYLYWYFHVIALFDEGTAIYRKVRQNMVMSAFGVRWLTVNGYWKTTYYGIDGNTLQPCYMWGERGGTFQHGGMIGHVIWTEELHIGSEVLTLTRNEKKASCEGWFYPLYVFPTLSEGGDCSGGLVEITGIDKICNGSVSGTGGVPLSYTVSCEGIVIDDNSYGSVDGSTNFQVYIFDSFQGEEWYFIIYSYDEAALSYTWMHDHYVNTYSFTRHYKMRYKHPIGNGDVNIGGWSNTVAGGTPNGTIILYPSCQINRGIISYTYVIANAATGVFQERVVGIYNVTNKTFPIGGSSYTSESIFGVDSETWKMQAAIGISK